MRLLTTLLSCLLSLFGCDTRPSTTSITRVVDQGTDRVADQARFSEVTAVLGDRLHYITQPNLGGAGGFSRGMRDATAAGDCQILLTDDDIYDEGGLLK